MCLFLRLNQIRKRLNDLTIHPKEKATHAAGKGSQEATASRPSPKAALFVAAFAAFLATFNETFLNVGFAPIMADLGVGVSTVQWLATAYMLGAAVMVPVSAFAYRSFPTRPLFCATVAFLVAGSVIGAIAQTFPVLLAGRIVQAIGTGMLIPIGMNITLEVAPREKLGTYMGIMGAMTTLGPSSSVIFAGLILAMADWHMLLWVFAALSALCLVAGAVFLRNVAHLTNPRLDAPSVALIGIALVGILYGVSTVFGGSIAIAVCTAAVGVLALVAFIKRQGVLDEPLIDLRPLSFPPFVIGVLANMLALIAIFAMNIIVPTFMQSALGTQPLVASLTLFPAILCSCAMSPVAGRIYDKRGAGALLLAGFVCIAAFSVLVSLLIDTASPVLLAVLYIPVICGSALIIGPVQSFALSKLPRELNPHGVTVMSTGFQIAGCFGSSVFTGVYGAVSASGMAAGDAPLAAASGGMLAAGVLVGAFALVGLGLSLWILKVERADAAAKLAARAASSESEPSVLEQIMKRDVYTLREDQTVLDAMRIFAEKKISGVPVLDARGDLFGFVSDGDVMRCLAKQVPAFKTAYSFIAEQENASFDESLRRAVGIKLSDICTRRVVSVDLEDDLASVSRVMVDGHLKKAPVMRDGRMVGIVNRSNITRYSIERYLAME